MRMLPARGGKVVRGVRGVRREAVARGIDPVFSVVDKVCSGAVGVDGGIRNMR